MNDRLRKLYERKTDPDCRPSFDEWKSELDRKYFVRSGDAMRGREDMGSFYVEAIKDKPKTEKGFYIVKDKEKQSFYIKKAAKQKFYVKKD